MFQFTHPGKGATVLSRGQYRATKFQFTHPGKGATISHASVESIVLFQFTHPGKGATCSRVYAQCSQRVSIHAPWEGCDKDFIIFELTQIKFQFTHPGKGATVWCKVAYYRADKQA